MRKLAEKVALVALVCIAFIFVLAYVLTTFNVVPIATQGTLSPIVAVVLAVCYVGLSAYLLYVNFAESYVINKVLLYSDSVSSTHATHNVITQLANNCAKNVDGVKISKIKIRPDDKLGFKLSAELKVNCNNVSSAVDKLRCLMQDAFDNVLNVRFSTIDFTVKTVQSTYHPDVDKAHQQAEQLNEQREQTQQYYEEPIDEP